MTYTYDGLNRVNHAVTQATTGGCWGQDFVYDQYGNLYQINIPSTHTACTNNRTLNVTPLSNNRLSGFSYDAAGNMINDGLYNYVYNAEGRQTSAAGVTYTYDGDGQRVKKSNGKLYWFGLGGAVLAETDLSGNNPTEQIYFGGQRVARRDPSGTVYYSFADHLGTTRIITDPAGAIKRGMDFQPFGFEVVHNGLITDNYKFTGLERDTETGNDHTLFRQYAFNLGRWYSPDPLAGSILNPQSLNRYAYVLNNPTNFIDPLGLVVQTWPCNVRIPAEPIPAAHQDSRP